MEKKTLIGSVRKNSMERVQVHVQEYRGVTCVDARVWLQVSAGGPEAVIPMKKGLCLRPELVKELLPLLAAAIDKAKALQPVGLDSDKSNALSEGEIYYEGDE